MIVGYVKARLAERSTWAAITLAITGGAALSSPYSWLAIAAGVAGALVPTSSGQ
ncbi:hypothetical protein UFOVP152_4 [uncultured Caudovirales phage]|uniref:Uncharacterized protein n=1 Tax=uncultured Caudovirales phage TaxID=2100421 RepID=A0A6J7W972_9CAUD|nr:hypothetical protein UFOVP152_4 [uncultured Caudovirales phage]